ncbi:MAG: ferredoxin [Muribaculaceae bacterium]|nr:ferredoxin [Muribaculaceae bacterium]
MIYEERQTRHERVILAAKQMLSAARTAPKAKGVDLIECAIIDGEDLKAVSAHLQKMGEELGRGGLLRDAANILQGECIVVIGTRLETMGLNCGHCGYPLCTEKPTEVPCAFNMIDVGIAVGSACATAADLRMDTRVMYSAGLAAQQLGLLPGCTGVQAIAVSCASKSPYFDRVRPQPK